MEKVISLSDISALEFNKVIIGGENIKIVDSHIDFAGKNNILFIENGVTLKNSVIRFNKDNSVIYLSKSKYIYYLERLISLLLTKYLKNVNQLLKDLRRS